MSSIKYTVDEFTKQCVASGYVSTGGQKSVREWCKEHPKEYYTDEDFIEVYRSMNWRGYPVSRWGWSCTANGRTTKRFLKDGGSEGNR